jgi:hypothetical protein
MGERYIFGCEGCEDSLSNEARKGGRTKMATIVRLLKGKTGKFCALACDNVAFFFKFIFNVKTVLILQLLLCETL